MHIKSKRFYIDCSCNEVSHTIFIDVVENRFGRYVEKEMTVNTSLYKNKNILDRILIALKYVFNYDVIEHYGYVDHLLTDDSIKQMKEAIRYYEEIKNDFKRDTLD